MRSLDVCRFLQNKVYFLPEPALPRPEASAPATPFWCAKTQIPVGPDGKDVRDDCCLAGRACFRAQVEI